MIQAVTTSAHRADFARRIAGKPYFEATMGTYSTLFGGCIGSGWSFYLLPGSGALCLHGGTATLCGQLPAGEPGAEAAEELQDFLQFLRVDRLLCETSLPLTGWPREEPLDLFELPKGQRLPALPAPPGLVLDAHPAMMAISQLVFADSKVEQEQFYSMACTSIAHGIGTCRALLHAGEAVCTVGCYAQSDTEAYLSAGVTAPGWRGRGLAGWLIVHLANELSAGRTVRFASAPALRPFYTRLGFTRCGILQQYIWK